jgi:ACS family hexuronate transporter-like MFS transporter
MKTGRCRCVVTLLLFVAGAINYMDRAALGVVAPISNKELSLSPSELGIVFSSFFVDYSIFAFIGGHQLISASRNLDDDRLRVFRLNRWERATAGPLVGLIEVAYGWCPSFVIVAALGIVWIVAWHLLGTDRPAENRCARAMNAR